MPGLFELDSAGSFSRGLPEMQPAFRARKIGWTPQIAPSIMPLATENGMFAKKMHQTRNTNPKNRILS